MIKKDIVIIDSGVENDHRSFMRFPDDIEGINFFVNSDGNIASDNNIKDNIGHGTAISYIIKNKLPECDIYMVKIFEDEMAVEIELLAKALEYICENIDCKIVHISNGYTQWDNSNKIYDLCYTLFSKGVIIVSSFDNNGRISYPAFFPFVIGVDSSKKCVYTDEYIYVDDEHINVQSFLFRQRLPWIENTMKEVSGNSFSSPYISCLIYSFLENSVSDFCEIQQLLKSKAKYIIEKPSCTSINTINTKNVFEINNAIMFPYNKEIISMSRFGAELNFQIKGIYDVKHLGNLGKTAVGHTIINYEKIEWESKFDTVILGHMNDLNNLLNRNVTEEIVEKCIKHQKNIFSFDDISPSIRSINILNYTGKIYYPLIDMTDVPQNRFGKMYDISIPVLAIMGTSSKQGKFTLQMELKQRFKMQNYSLGMIGTEPSSLLCGFDYCYPIGYENNVKINSYNAILCLNNMIHELEMKESDILITGSQSQSLHLNTGNVGLYPLYQYEFLCGTMPDAIVLCVNYEDEEDYINSTILFLETVSSAQVISLVIFPFKKFSEWSVLNDTFVEIERGLLEERKKYLENKFRKKVFISNDSVELDTLFNRIIEFFEE
jgi:uncharacterized NAD-dependent epimerase/dehydratase family protein